MTVRQKILRFIYPLLVALGKIRGGGQVLTKPEKSKSMKSFYGLDVQLNNNSLFHFEELKGKKVLLVNTASNCGYTNQYTELQKLYEQEKVNLVIIGFPANDFKEQEKGTDEEIAQFCQVNFGVSFPLVKKSTVLKTNHQHPVFQWLTHKELNGWNEQEPVWNFSKYLVNERGELTHFFDPSVSPLDQIVTSAVKK
jgi:glutathione peroxidase